MRKHSRRGSLLGCIVAAALAGLMLQLPGGAAASSHPVPGSTVVPARAQTPVGPSHRTLAEVAAGEPHRPARLHAVRTGRQGPASGNLTITGGGYGPPGGPAPLNVSFETDVSGGVPPYSFTYEFGDGIRSINVTNASGVNVTHTYNRSGFFNGTLYANDSVGDDVNYTFQVIVVSHALVAEAPAITPSVIDVGQQVNLLENASGGDPPYNYSWWGTGVGASGLPPGCSDPKSNFGFSPLPQLICTPNASGLWPIESVVQDSAFEEAVSNSSFLTVAPDPSFEYIGVSPNLISPGMTTTLTAHFSGGSGGNRFSWSDLPAGCASSNSSAIDCTPTQPGTFAIEVSETDLTGASANGTGGPLYVVPALVVFGPNVTRSVMDIGQSVTFTSGAAGGSGGFSYAWFGLPSGCSSANATTISCDPSGTGVSHVSVEVTDARDDSVASSPVNLTVEGRLGAQLVVSANSTQVGAEIGVMGLVFNGTAPYTFAFSGMPHGCSLANPAESQINCTAQQAGSFLITLTVTDRVGEVATSNSTMVVAALPASASGGSTLWLAIGAGAGLVIAGLAGGVFLRRRGRAPPASTGPDPPPSD